MKKEPQSPSVTVNDILDKLEEDIVDDYDNRSVQITLFPPVCDAIDSDGDSDDEARMPPRVRSRIFQENY